MVISKKYTILKLIKDFLHQGISNDERFVIKYYYKLKLFLRPVKTWWWLRYLCVCSKICLISNISYKGIYQLDITDQLSFDRP